MGKEHFEDQRPAAGRDEGPEAVVLGLQMAKAAAAEERHKAKGMLRESPIPGQKYDHNGDELGLLRPRLVPLDSALADLTREFAKSDEHGRAAIRDAISMDEFYTIMEFSKRSAVFALRDRARERVREGLTAIAMIEAERVDWRDILVALSLLNHAAERIGANVDQLFGEASQLSEPNVASLIEGFQKRAPDDKSLRTSWGYEEVVVDNKVGVIGWGFHPYHPTRALTKVAIEMADFIAKDKYCADSVEIASDLPRVWLEMKDNAMLEKAAKAIRACAHVSARLMPDEQADADSQMFVIFLVETTDESAANALLELSQKKKPEDYAMLGVAEKNLFCLVVARSFVLGVDSFETAQKLSRLSNGLHDILVRHTR